MTLQVVWFRRDLRLGDHPALSQAASEGSVLPLFILDPALLHHPETGVARVVFLLNSLRALAADLERCGSRLLLRHGEPAAVLQQVVHQYRADGVVAHADAERILGRVRDARVESWLRGAGIPMRWFEQPGYIGDLVAYPTYRHRWHSTMAEPTLPLPSRLHTPPAPAEEPSPSVPTLADLGLPHDTTPQPEAGSHAALARLHRFCNEPVSSRYHWQLSYPAARASSGLSPYLKFGVLSHRQAVQAIEPLRLGEPAQRRSWRQLVSRLRWGAGMAMRFRYLPQLELEPLWECHRDSAALSEPEELMYRRWQEGTTGFPIVDAAARCLLATGGWRELNFRSRAIHASFLTNLCGIDWRYGALHYMRHLLDGDCPIDHYQWAMQAGVIGPGSGAWHRIYHPGQVAVDRCDPQGVFIRRWLPELAELTNDQLGQPPAMASYPPPMLDYASARRHRLSALEARRTRWRPNSYSPLPERFTPFGADRFPPGPSDWCGSRTLLPAPIDPASLDRHQAGQLQSWFLGGGGRAAQPNPVQPRASRKRGGVRRQQDPGVTQLSLFP